MKNFVIGYLLDDTLDKPDGVQQAVLAIGQEMTNRGHEVHYIVMDTRRRDLDNVHSLGKFLSMKFNGNSVRTPLPVPRRRIRQFFNEVELDVLHVQMPFSPFFSAKVINMAPKHTMIFGTFHILPYNRFTMFATGMLGLILKKSIHKLSASYGVSEPACLFMEKTFKISGGVLSNPVDYSFFSSFKRQKRKKLQIVFVGRFDRRKGVIQLIEAYGNLPNDVLNTTELTMCGRGPLLEKAKELSAKNHLEVTFPGFVSDDEKAQYLANADISVFPSISGESFGIVLAEAMAARSGVVLGGNNPGYASVLGAWPEVLFDPNNSEEFTTRLVSFVSDPALRDRIGKLQHQYVKNFDVKVVADKLLKNYQKSHK